MAHALPVGDGDELHLPLLQPPARLEVRGERREVQLVVLRALVGEEEVARVPQPGLGECACARLRIGVSVFVLACYWVASLCVAPAQNLPERIRGGHSEFPQCANFFA